MGKNMVRVVNEKGGGEERTKERGEERTKP
jgi:hypothetical protein